MLLSTLPNVAPISESAPAADGQGEGLKPPEDDLVSRAQGGDSAAWDLLLRRHRDDIARIAFRYLGPSTDLEDVVQDALVHVYRSLPNFRGQSKFSTWLFRLVANVAKMHLRAKASRPKLASAEAQQAPRIDGASRLADEDTARQRRVAALYQQLAGLSEKKREVLVLHDFEGCSPKRIAELVQAPVMTVRTRLFYARRDLYRAMASDPELRELAAEIGDLPAAGGGRGQP